MRGKGSPQLRAMGWETLLQMWALLLDYYDTPDQSPDDRDIAYWYGEQTLNGVLAAAAWKVPGGWSLQEFTGEKTPRISHDVSGAIAHRRAPPRAPTAWQRVAGPDSWPNS